MATAQEIVSFLEANPNLSDREIAAAMEQYGVTPQQLAQAVNMPVADIQSRYDAATQPESRIALPDTIPARPTFSGVAAEWNDLHKQRFGTYLNLAGRENDPAIAAQVAELQATTTAAQNAWDALYGDTPEGKIIKENPPPDWRDTYEPWLKQYTDAFGGIVNRPWSSDADAINQKAELDKAYLKSVEDYNKKHGTNIAPDPDVLGSMVQPNEFYKAPDKKRWYENPVKAALALAAIAGGGYYLLGPGSAAAGASGAGAAGAGAAGAAGGAAGGTGLTIGAGGATGLTAGAGGVGFTAPAGFTLAPGIGTSLAAGGVGTTILLDGAYTSRIGETGLLADAAGTGLQIPTTPGLSAMGGAQGITVPVAGGTVSALGFVPAGATPILGDAGSFINNPNVLGNTVFSTDTLVAPGTTGFDWQKASDIARGINSARGLLGGDEQQQVQAAGGAALQAFPFPSIYGPVQVGLLPLAQQFQRPSLLG